MGRPAGVLIFRGSPARSARDGLGRTAPDGSGGGHAACDAAFARIRADAALPTAFRHAGARCLTLANLPRAVAGAVSHRAGASGSQAAGAARRARRTWRQSVRARSVPPQVVVLAEACQPLGSGWLRRAEHLLPSVTGGYAR